MKADIGGSNMTAVAVIGMPRSGSTIIASFINSIDRATIWGEPHHYQAQNNVVFKTRYGNRVLIKDADVLQQIRDFSAKKDLAIYGFKELWNISTNLCPIEVVRHYKDRLQATLVSTRHPRKTYGSLLALGFPKSITPEIFSAKYIEFCTFCLENDRCSPVFLDEFRATPMKSVAKATGWEISGELAIKQYTGGGDLLAMGSSKIISHDQRAGYIGEELDDATDAYHALMQEYNV